MTHFSVQERIAISRRRFILRSIILGALLIALNCYWIVSAENRVVWELTDFSIFPTVLFTLFLFGSLNLLLKRYASDLAFEDGEVATIYIMISVATALAGHDIVRQLVPLMANPFWFATTENEWEDLFFRFIPDWLAVSNRRILQGYFEGDENFWQQHYINAWSIPVLAWTVFVVVLLVVMLCLNIIIRRQWIEHEKLSYPLTVMPIEVIGNSKQTLSNRLIWLGFGLAFGLEMLAGLSYLFPFIPALKVKSMLHFSDRPWNAMGGVPIYVYPFAIGLGYLMPLDLSFSLWIFFLIWKLQAAIFSATGWSTALGLQTEQRAGAWLGIGLIALWTSRKHIWQIISSVFALRQNDGLYRFAVAGGLLGFIFMLFFWAYAGLSPWVATGYFLAYFVFCTAMTRMRAELGPPTHELHGVHPDRLMVTLLGSRVLGATNLTNTTLLSWLAYGYRCHPMPHQLEGFKIGSYFKISEKRLVMAIIMAIVVGAFLSIGLHVSLYYKYRFARWGVGEFHYLRNLIAFPRQPNFEALSHIGFGIALTVVMTLLKRRFLWWPLYPVGYAVGNGWAIGWMWFSIFLGWLAKRTSFAIGGVRHYRQLLPLFLGLIFGQFLAGSLWSLLGIIFNRNVYTLFP